MAGITIERVSKVYGDGTLAVDDLNLAVGEGEFVVLVGPSGCGKTTALRMVAGLEEITEGTVHVGERLVNDLPPKDRDIAMVFQNYALYPHMTAFDNIGFGLKMRGVPKREIEHQVVRAAKVLGLEEVLRKKPRTLSGGQRQRVAMGRAIVREPRASAGGGGPRTRAGAARFPDGRAAVEPGREAARGDARRDHTHPTRPR